MDSPLEIECNRDPRVREGYSLSRGSVTGLERTIFEEGEGGKNLRDESGKETTTAARRVEQVACRRWRTVVGWWSNEEGERTLTIFGKVARI